MFFDSLTEISGKILIALADAAANALRARKVLRNSVLIACMLSLSGALVVAINPEAVNLKLSARTPAIVTAVAIFLILATCLLAYTDLRLSQVTISLQQKSVSHVLGDQLRDLGQERKVLEKRLIDQSVPSELPPNSKKEDLFDANLELNLNQLREYYVINKSQARSSFRMGVTAVLLGLIAILVGVGLIYAGGGKNHIGVAIATAVAGLLGQFIGGSCFYLFNKAQDQSVHYYDRLTELQGTLLAVQLAGSITELEIADSTRQQIVFALIKASPQTMSSKSRSRANQKKADDVPSTVDQSPNGSSETARVHASSG